MPTLGPGAGLISYLILCQYRTLLITQDNFLTPSKGRDCWLSYLSKLYLLFHFICSFRLVVEAFLSIRTSKDEIEKKLHP